MLTVRLTGAPTGRACRALIAAFAACASFAAGATPTTLIDTLPLPGAATGAQATYASGRWLDVAVGFTAPGAGTITRIETSLTALPSPAPFFFGVAGNGLIGNPAATYFTAPPDSLAEYTVCAAGAACNASGPWGAPDFAIEQGEGLAFDTGIELAAGGTYWLYTRFYADEVYASWLTDTATQTGLLATRSGICTGLPGSCDIEAHRTFSLVAGERDAPGVRVLFEPAAGLYAPLAAVAAPDGQVPEPGTLALVGLGLLGAAGLRRRTTRRS